jgi:hypothetical protein
MFIRGQKSTLSSFQTTRSGRRAVGHGRPCTMIAPALLWLLSLCCHIVLMHPYLKQPRVPRQALQRVEALHLPRNLRHGFDPFHLSWSSELNSDRYPIGQHRP